MATSERLNLIPSTVLSEPKNLKIDVELLQFIAIIFDAIFVICVGFVTDHLVLGRDEFFPASTIVAIISSIIFVAVMMLRKGYSIESLSSHQEQIRQIALAWVYVFFIVTWFAFLFKIGGGFSRFGVLLFLAMAVSGLVIAHIGFSAFLRLQLSSGRLHLQRVFIVIIGDMGELDQIKEKIRSVGISLVDYYVVAPNTRFFAKECINLSNRIRSTLVNFSCDAVIIVAPWDNQRRIRELLEAIRPFPMPAVLMADRTSNGIVSQAQLRFGTLTGFEVQRAPLSRMDRILKRAFDVSIATTAIGILGLLMALTSVAILVGSGRPILFRQIRKGFGGRTFQILKFRTMSVQDDGPFVLQAQRNDRRVTPLGRILRRTSIDELPQLFNVIKGNMSIVGPRPHALAHDNHYDELIATYAYRHHVKPGITGWAQINGCRGETRELKDMEARVEHDLWYINNWSIWLDFRIVLQTAISVLMDKNAF